MATDQSVPSVPASDVPPTLPNPFAQLSRFETFRAAVEPLAAEFWAAREPLKTALLALEHAWEHERDSFAARCLAVGDELRKAGLLTFAAEMANALKLPPTPTPEQVAEQTAWCLLAAATAGDANRVNELFTNAAAHPAVREELAHALEQTTETCLSKWYCEVSPRYAERAGAELARLNLTSDDAVAWIENGSTGFTPSGKSALRGWLHTLRHGEPLAGRDLFEEWEAEVSRPLTPPATAHNTHPPTTDAQTASGETHQEPVAAPTAPKRSTERGEGRTKFIAALTSHHRYAEGECLNQEPIGNNELARLASVSESAVSEFLANAFKGHTKYRGMCQDVTGLVASLKLLNNEFAPHHLFGSKPPSKDDDDGE